MRSQVGYRFSFGGSLSPVVKVLIIVNVLIFILVNLARDPVGIITFLGLVPSSVWKDRSIWQLVTYMFVHIDFWHVLLNMLVLWWFGCDIERSFGKKYFLRYYFFTGIGAGILALILGWGSIVPIIGASGAIFGVLLAYAILFPNRLIYIFFILPVRAKWAVLGFALLEIFAVMGTPTSGVSHSAHLGGIIFGLLWFGYYLKFFNIRELKGKFSRRSKPRLKVVSVEDDDIDNSSNDKGETVH